MAMSASGPVILKGSSRCGTEGIRLRSSIQTTMTRPGHSRLIKKREAWACGRMAMRVASL